jgi:hypothetical protein
MAENQNSFGILGDLAEVADKIQKMYVGRATILFELSKPEFDRALRSFEKVDLRTDSFKIDISGTEFIYIMKPE